MSITLLFNSILSIYKIWKLRFRKLNDFLRSQILNGKPRSNTQANQKEKYIMINSYFTYCQISKYIYTVFFPLMIVFW